MKVSRIFTRDVGTESKYWRGILELPVLIEEVLADKTTIGFNTSREFETSLIDWWSSFIVDSYL
ncbi:MAG TPA: hypothetical protein DEP01_03055 [Aminobacterium sp.]|jgi:hypothetical protein|uniref:hypothetical protein n=1 Tax=Aminobacterium TaxID=81466 RepID=UPI0004635872|nr:MULTISPECIES: hypothetical protein [Aminobacterium]HCA40567.1 hypothetical protein [Aminobacterium sp.]